jgi:hypothetical protein
LKPLPTLGALFSAFFPSVNSPASLALIVCDFHSLKL